MKTLNDFKKLDENEKGEIVFKGTFLGDRKENGIAIQLYSLENFYVEVYYDPAENKIVRFRAFKKLQGLAPFFNI